MSQTFANHESSMPGARLVVMDVDSTLIDQEVIEVLAAQAGTQEQVADITHRAMNGEIDFAESLRKRVETLAGLSVEIFEQAAKQVTLTRGVREFIAYCHERNWQVALVSGGFIEVVELLARPLGITRIVANRLDASGGILTGKTIGPVIDAAAKQAALTDFAAEFAIPLHDTVAIGDGANDLLMLQRAGIGIAFCAKPFLQQRAPYTVDERNFLRVIELLEQIDSLSASGDRS